MKFGYSAESVKALEKKEEISKKIIEILKMQKLSGRKCKYCGKPLEWNYPYGMCNNCHEERYPRRSYYYGYVMDDWDDSDDD